MAASMAATAGVAKVGNAFGRASKSFGGGETSAEDEENPRKRSSVREDEDPGINLCDPQDLIKYPCLFLPICTFTLGGLIGLIMIPVFFAVGTSAGVVCLVSLFLFVVGMWAAWEVRSLGSVMQQVKWLKVIRHKLQEDSNALNNEVQELEGENRELADNVTNLKDKNEKLGESVKEFDEQNTVLAATSEALEKQNTHLKENGIKLKEANEKLSDTVGNMGAEVDELNDSLIKFDDLRTNIESMAEQQGLESMDLMDSIKSTYSQMDELVKQNEIVMLNQLAADVEFMDSGEGISPREFKRFVARLPRRYKSLLKEKNLTFEDFDPDNNGNIDVSELQNLIDRLVTMQQEAEDQNATN